jgi:hypothetical protein
MAAEDGDTKLQAMDTRLAHLETIVSEMRNGLTRLTWAVILSGGVITIFLGMTLATVRR